MTARLESFLAKVESGAEKVVARALRGFRYRKPLSPNPATAPNRAEPTSAEPTSAAPTSAEATSATPATAPNRAEPTSAEATSAAPTSVRPAIAEPSITEPKLALAFVGEGSNVERPNAPEAELPASYGRSRVVVLAIDPYHVHAYWEITPDDGSDARERVDRFGLVTPTWVLRFYDVTGVDPADTSEALVGHAHFDVEIDPSSRSWYVELWAPNKTYIVELGVRISNRFTAVCRANPVHVPPADPSLPEAPEWRKADPQHATTHSVAEAELPAYGVSAVDERAQPWQAGSGGAAQTPFGAAFVPESISGEQPWVLASAGLIADSPGGELNAASRTDPGPPFAAPQGTGGAAEAQHAAEPERSRSVSLRAVDGATGQRPDSGGARPQSRSGAPGGDSSE